MVSSAIVMDKANVAEVAGQLERLGFRVRLAKATDCGASDPGVDFYLVAARSPTHLNKLLTELKIAEENRVLAFVDRESLTNIDLKLADDFIPLPLEPDTARIRLQFHLDKQRKDRDARLQVEGLVLGLDNFEVTVDGRLVQLTFKEFELLKFLMSHRGRVFSRPRLVEEIWQYDYFSGTRTVDVHVRRLRAKLGPKYGYYIQTVRNVGYRFGRK